MSSSSREDKSKEEPSSELQQAIENAKREAIETVEMLLECFKSPQEVLQQLERLKKVEPTEQRMKAVTLSQKYTCRKDTDAHFR